MIHSYTSGWTGPETVADPPTEGAIDFLKAASERFQIYLLSARFSLESDKSVAIKAVLDWFESYGLPRDWFSVEPDFSGKIVLASTKPRAHCIIDDRAYRFEGTFPTLEELSNLAPWNRRTKAPMSKPEYRFVGAPPAVTPDGCTIEGYAVHWNVRCTKPKVTSRNGRPFAFWEKIAPYAFKESRDAGDDVMCTRDHNAEKILGRTRAGTLEVTLDDSGCFYRCNLPDVSYANNLKVSITRKDVYGNSFGMYVVKDAWAKAEDGLPERTIVEAILFDTSPVTEPTYEDAEVVLNSLDRYLTEDEKAVIDPWLERTAMMLKLLK